MDPDLVVQMCPKCGFVVRNDVTATRQLRPHYTWRSPHRGLDCVALAAFHDSINGYRVVEPWCGMVETVDFLVRRVVVRECACVGCVPMSFTLKGEAARYRNGEVNWLAYNRALSEESIERRFAQEVTLADGFDASLLDLNHGHLSLCHSFHSWPLALGLAPPEQNDRAVRKNFNRPHRR